jgi:hypothetical protein
MEAWEMDFSHRHNRRVRFLTATLRFLTKLILASSVSLPIGDWARAEVIAPSGTQPRRESRPESRQQVSPKSANTAQTKKSGATASSGPGASGAKGGGVAATITTEEALVYSRPDFDASVIATLSYGRQVRVSRTTIGRVAKFHRVRIGGRTGYIVDIDLSIAGAKSAAAAERKSQKQAASRAAGKKKKSANEPSKDKDPRDRPIYFARFVGVLGGALSFKEDVSGQENSASLAIYGLKITGPDVVFEGPVLDINLALHYGAPDYYDSLSSIKPAGFLLLTDTLILLPLLQGHNGMMFLGFGPLVTYSSFRIVRNNRLEELTRFGVGGSLSIGSAFRYENIAFRLEGKYYLETKSHQSIQASIQTGF